MSSQTTRQQSLFGDRDEDYGTLTIENGELYPFVRLLRALVDEAKFQFTDNGISVCAVDPANVAMADVTLACDHGIDPTAIGVNVKRLASILGNKPRSVTVEIDFARPWGTLTVDREYANGHVWNVTERMGFIDPDSVREEPDVPELKYDATATVPVDPLASYINTTHEDSSAIELESTDGEVSVSEIDADSDTTSEYLTRAETDCVADGEATAIYSGDYLTDIVNAIRTYGADTADLSWSDEYPIRIDIDAGSFLLAPRVRSN